MGLLLRLEVYMKRRASLLATNFECMHASKEQTAFDGKQPFAELPIRLLAGAYLPNFKTPPQDAAAPHDNTGE